MVIMYDRTQIEIEKAWFEKHHGNKVDESEEINIRLSENITYVFRMFLIAMVFIVFVLSISG